MTTIKSFTDLSQSKTLSEILPLESADAYWWYNGQRYYVETKEHNDFQKSDIPAWSLSALYNVLPTIDDEFEPQLHRSLDKYRCTYEGEEDSSGLFRVADNPVDACYEIILKLHELKLL